MNIQSYFESIKNTKLADKPNEDACLCDAINNIYIIVDGVSRDRENGVYPNPSPSLEVSKLFVKTAYDKILKMMKQENESDYNKIIWEAVKTGNEKIKQYNYKYYKGSFLPGTVGIVSVIKDNVLYYVYIGDCYGRIVSCNKINIFTQCQTAAISKNKYKYTANKIRNEICNNIKHPCGYGVLNGENGAVDFLVGGNIRLESRGRIILSSDGLEDYLKTLNIKEMLDKEERLFIREAVLKNNINADDRTIIVVTYS